MRVFIPFLFTVLTSSSLVFADQEYSYSRTPSPLPPRIAASPSSADAPLKPSIAVAIAILTTTFFVIFLILLYLKHCKQGSSNSTGYFGYAEPSSHEDRKNSGINRLLIESLPVFRFKSLRGHKDGLECAVCLNKFEASELLRLLPKCKHAFHVECVDTWLDAHSTCPLCRYRVHPEDILLMGDNEYSQRASTQEGEKHEEDVVLDMNPRRVSGRHSSAGERKIVSEESKATILQNRHSADTMTRISNSSSSNAMKAARKDGLLLSGKTRKLDHKINIVWSAIEVSGPTCKTDTEVFRQERWSDVHISDLMYVRPSQTLRHEHDHKQQLSSLDYYYNKYHNNYINGDGQQGEDGRNVINGRSASEITGVARFSSSGIIRYGQGHEGREGGVVSRLLGWIYPNAAPHSTSLSQPAVWSGLNATTRSSLV